MNHILTTHEEINAYRLLTIRSMLKLESVGIRKSGLSALSLVKGMGIKARTAREALPLFEQSLREQGILS